MEPPPTQHDIFVSFADGDRGLALWLTRRLQWEGFSAFFYPDKNNIVGWEAKLYYALEQARCAIFLFSKHSPASEMQQAEHKMAARLRLKRMVLQAGAVPPEVRKTAMVWLGVEPSVSLTGSWGKDRPTIAKILDEFGVDRRGHQQSQRPTPTKDAARLSEVIEQAARVKTKDKGVPRPKVAAALVWNNEVLWRETRDFDGDHAEQRLLRLAPVIPEATTLLTTLEPCARNIKRSPSCAEAIAARPEISRVVIARLDSNPEMRGKGVAILQQANKEVILARQRLFRRAAIANREYVEFFERADRVTRKKILIAVPAFQEMPFFAELLQALLKALHSRNEFDAVPSILGASHDDNAQLGVLSQLKDRQPDYQAYVLFPTPPTQRLREALTELPGQLRKPVIFLDIDPFEGAELKEERTYFFGSKSGGALAADFLKGRLGVKRDESHARVLVICSKSIKASRQDEFVSRLDRSIDPVLEDGASELSRDEGRRLATAHLRDAKDSPFRAIYATTDELAIGAFEAASNELQEGRGTMPDVILGFDGLQEMRKRIRAANGRLATLAQDMHGIAEAVVTALEAELTNSGSGAMQRRRLEFLPQLVER